MSCTCNSAITLSNSPLKFSPHILLTLGFNYEYFPFMMAMFLLRQILGRQGNKKIYMNRQKTNEFITRQFLLVFILQGSKE
jgi:hypothetical protein